MLLQQDMEINKLGYHKAACWKSASQQEAEV